MQKLQLIKLMPMRRMRNASCAAYVAAASLPSAFWAAKSEFINLMQLIMARPMGKGNGREDTGIVKRFGY